MADSIYQIKISLKRSEPKIWRKILIPSDLLLEDFHKIIQTTMGWENSHLHQFIKNNFFYLAPHDDDDMWDEMDSLDYKKEKIKVSKLLIAEKDKITYEYDFGDGWEHEITLDKILPFDNKIKYPICIGGKMKCPPENCGGVWGYSHLLYVLKQPKHPEYKDFKEWYGKDFDPEYFDKKEINDFLAEENYGCFEF